MHPSASSSGIELVGDSSKMATKSFIITMKANQEKPILFVRLENCDQGDVYEKTFDKDLDVVNRTISLKMLFGIFSDQCEQM